MDLSIIPEVIGDSIGGAARTAAALGYYLNPTPVRQHVDKHTPIVTEKAKEFKDESLPMKVSDTADFVSMIPVAGWGGAAAKGAISARRTSKAGKAVMKQRVKNRIRRDSALVDLGHEKDLSKAALKKAKWRSMHDKEFRREIDSRYGKDSLNGVIAQFESVHNYAHQVAKINKAMKKVKKGAKIAEKNSSEYLKYKAIRKAAAHKAVPSRSAIAGLAYQMSKKKAQR